MSRPRYRFAPTPSRELHVGNALAALFGWARARAAGGAFVLRIEDINRARSKEVHERAIYRDLATLGIDWDEGPDVGGPFAPYRQSERLAGYDAILARLDAAGLVYPCVCSRADIRGAQSAPHAADGELAYPGTCRGRPRDARLAQPRDDRGGFRLDLEAVRAELGIAPIVAWHDALRGPQLEDVRLTSGDPLLGRVQSPTYQLAVVADDRAMHVSDVVRGVDLIGSTARQIVLHRTLAHVLADTAPRPRFAHHPLIVDDRGHKLSKRDAAIAISAFAADPARLRALLGRAIGLFGAGVQRAEPADWISVLAAHTTIEEASELHDGSWPPGDASAPP